MNRISPPVLFRFVPDHVGTRVEAMAMSLSEFDTERIAATLPEVKS